MGRRATFTEAEIKRAMSAATSTGLTVSRIIITKAGDIVIDCGGDPDKPLPLDLVDFKR